MKTGAIVYITGVDDQDSFDVDQSEVILTGRELRLCG